MRGDFTRDTRERARRAGIRSVLLQQGRPLVDADWNEQAGITADRAETLARHVIGGHGAPREEAGFGVSVSGNALFVGAGYLYAEGLPLHNPATLDYAAQQPSASFTPLATLLPNNTEGFVYAEAVLRPSSAGVQPFLSDPALGGIDPVVREEVDWAIRVVRLAETGVSAAAMRQAFATNQPLAINQWRTTTGGLDADVQTESETTDPGPCELPPTAGYLDQVNRLYRVEVHASGEPGTATFKWAEDAGIEAGLVASGAGFAIDLPIERAGAWFPVDAIVEVIDDARERAGEPGPMGRITSAVGDALVIDGVAASALSARVRIRRWASMPVTIPTGNAWTVLSKGVKVRFCAGYYARGSAWTIPARTVLGDIMWPPYQPADRSVTIAGQPVGFYAPSEGRRRYAPLAIILRDASGTLGVTDDLRDVFSPLTDQRAVDIRFDDSIAQLGATNVQQAIDELAVRDAACCTWHVLPVPGWETVFAQIPNGRSGKICFAAGNYPLTGPVTIAGKGHLKLVGAGPATKIWCHGRAQALHFENCASVEVSDMTIAAEQNFAQAKGNGPGQRITGALDCSNCGPVRVERCVLVVSAPRAREAVCLRIASGETPGSGDCIIRDNDIVAGDLTSGILILDGADVSITGNRIRPRAERSDITTTRWLGDKRIVAILSRLAFSHAIPSANAVRPARRANTRLFNEVTLQAAATSTRFYSASAVIPANWTAFAAAFDRFHAGRSNPHWRWLMGRTVQKLWRNNGDVQLTTNFTLFRNLYTVVMRTIAPTIEVGIIVAGSRLTPLGSGSRATSIRVSGNTLTGVATGVRIARSLAGGAGARIGAPSVRVTENRIVMAGVPLDMQRCGVQIANPERAWVTDNDILLETADPNADQTRMTQLRNANFHLLETDGIRLAGAIGQMFTVRGNSVRDCRTGVRVDTIAVEGKGSTKQWIVADNAVTGAGVAYELDGRCKNRDNLTG
ncbi:DUF6519 domain-containing protein [Erythrobacter colymbi]|uniref:DUF6519 domain-containing protein n=1 Tax=Erythrobacter colymbi TaxID=1161202 RepID=UPI00117D02AC|nr:DUF6519 domain-containing protein [Erythrobacter colymbi]